VVGEGAAALLRPHRPYRNWLGFGFLGLCNRQAVFQFRGFTSLGPTLLTTPGMLTDPRAIGRVDACDRTGWTTVRAVIESDYIAAAKAIL
jgi:hypothetical protein